MKKKCFGLLIFMFSFVGVVVFAQAQNSSGVPKEVLDNYVEAIGGKRKVKRIKNLTIKMSSVLEGSSLRIVKYKKSPNKLRKELKDGMLLIETKVCDGDKGRVINLNNDMMIEGNELENLKFEAVIFPELAYEDLDIEYKILGMDTVRGQMAYKMQITRPTGSQYLDYYDKETRLKLRTDFVPDSVETIGKRIDYDEYREFSEVLFPTKIVYVVGKQTFVMKLLIDAETKISNKKFSVED